MKYFIELSMEGSFPSGMDDEGTYEIPERLYNQFIAELARGIYAGVVKKI